MRTTGLERRTPITNVYLLHYYMIKDFTFPMESLGPSYQIRNIKITRSMRAFSTAS